MAHAPNAMADAHAAAEAAAHGGEQGAFPPFDPALFSSQLIWFALTFGLLYLVVSHVVLPSVANVLAGRAAKLSEDLGAAAQNSEQAEAQRAAAEQVVARARNDARTVVEEKRADVQAELEAEQAKVDAALAERAAAAELKIAELRAKALAEMDKVAADLAQAIVAKVLPNGGRASAAAAAARPRRIVERHGENQ